MSDLEAAVEFMRAEGQQVEAIVGQLGVFKVASSRVLGLAVTWFCQSAGRCGRIDTRTIACCTMHVQAEGICVYLSLN